MFNKVKQQKICFIAGCIALTCAVLAVTLFPFLINSYMSKVFVPAVRYKTFAFVFYFLTVIFFLNSKKYFSFQLKWIGITAVYYIAFQTLAKLFM